LKFRGKMTLREVRRHPTFSCFVGKIENSHNKREGEERYVPEVHTKKNEPRLRQTRLVKRQEGSPVKKAHQERPLPGRKIAGQGSWGGEIGVSGGEERARGGEGGSTVRDKKKVWGSRQTRRTSKKEGLLLGGTFEKATRGTNLGAGGPLDDGQHRGRKRERLQRAEKKRRLKLGYKK